MKQKTIHPKLLIVLLGILAALGPFSIDMYIPSFRQIATDFNVSEKQVAFTLTSYFLGITVGQLIYGPLVDRYGRKKPLLIGLLIYTAASIGCSLTTSLPGMITYRVLQALGACVGMVASSSIVVDVFGAARRANVFSYIMLVMGIAPLIAPSMGGFLMTRFHWTAIFYFLAAFAGFVIVLIFIFLPETNKFIHSYKIQVGEIARSYYQVLKNKIFFTYTMAASLSFGILFAYISSASFIFLTHYALSVKTYSVLFAINASGLIIGNFINGQITKRYNYIKIARIATFVLILFTLLELIIVITVPHIGYKWMVSFIFITLFILGFIFPNATAASLVPFAKKAGSASALGGSVKMAASAVASAAIGVIHNGTLTPIFITMFISALLTFYFIVPNFKHFFSKKLY